MCVCILEALCRGPCTCIMCWQSKKWWVAPESTTIGGMWFCWNNMWVASKNLVQDEGSGAGDGSGVGSSLLLPVFHLRFG